jgi:hypothetical protein
MRALVYHGPKNVAVLLYGLVTDAVIQAAGDR